MSACITILKMVLLQQCMKSIEDLLVLECAYMAKIACLAFCTIVLNVFLPRNEHYI